jgi:hypothetical protein
MRRHRVDRDARCDHLVAGQSRSDLTGGAGLENTRGMRILSYEDAGPGNGVERDSEDENS